MKKLWLLMAFAAVLVLGACGGGDSGGGSEEPSDEGAATEEESSEESTEESAEEGSDSASTGDTALAKEAYQKNTCASCHGEDLSGASGPALTNVGSEHSEEEIRTQIEEGGDGMPGGLVTDEEELDALVTWLASQKGE